MWLLQQPQGRPRACSSCNQGEVVGEDHFQHEGREWRARAGRCTGEQPQYIAATPAVHSTPCGEVQSSTLQWCWVHLLVKLRGIAGGATGSICCAAVDGEGNNVLAHACTAPASAAGFQSPYGTSSCAQEKLLAAAELDLCYQYIYLVAAPAAVLKRLPAAAQYAVCVPRTL